MKALVGAFDVIPGALWALLLAGALALIGVKHVQLSTARAAAAEARADLADYKATAAETARLAERAERHEEARRNSVQRKALDEAAIETRAANLARDSARTAHELVRKQTAQYAAAARAARDRAAAVETSAATGDPIGVLADVLGRCSQRVSVLAAYADDARVAGKLCERSYDALTP